MKVRVRTVEGESWFVGEGWMVGALWNSAVNDPRAVVVWDDGRISTTRFPAIVAVTEPEEEEEKES